MEAWHGVDVEGLWQTLRETARGLQNAELLPPSAQLYDPQLDVIKRYLIDGMNFDATVAARELGKGQAGAGYLAFELIKAFYLELGWTGWAKMVGKEAAALLRKARPPDPKRR